MPLVSRVEERRVGQQADAARGVGVDGGVAGADERRLEQPGRLADLAVADGRDHRRQRHRADQQDDEDHHQQLDQGEAAADAAPAALTSSLSASW